MTKTHSRTAEMRLYSYDNQRLYLNDTERPAFIAAAFEATAIVRIFCLTLAFTGCRLSEARYLKKSDIQHGEQLVSFATLKKRKPGHIREVPVPSCLMREIERIHFGKTISDSPFLFSDDPKPPPRIACYRWIKAAMAQAGVEGAQARPKGLRHAYGIHAIKHRVPLHMLQKWMGQPCPPND